MNCPERVRELAVKYRQNNSIKETCEAFEISATALNKRVNRYKQTGSLANKALNRKHKKTEPEKPLKDVGEHTDDFNCERAQRFGRSAEAVRLAVKKLKITRKKRRQSAGREGERQECLEKITTIPKETVVYADESGIKAYYQRLYAYALTGMSVCCGGKESQRKMMNITGAYCNGRHVAIKMCEHTTDSAFFEKRFSQALLPEAPGGFTVITDNASFHREQALPSLIKESGKNITLLFLPAYSPDFNPIEHSRGNLKKFLGHFSRHFDSLPLAISHFFHLV